jgi:hypothetical protein
VAKGYWIIISNFVLSSLSSSSSCFMALLNKVYSFLGFRNVVDICYDFGDGISSLHRISTYTAQNKYGGKLFCCLISEMMFRQDHF